MFFLAEVLSPISFNVRSIELSTIFSDRILLTFHDSLLVKLKEPLDLSDPMYLDLSLRGVVNSLEI